MKFSENGLYIERYVKCSNCGVLIYEQDAPTKVKVDGKEFCSDWCVKWSAERQQRRASK
ncbi:hypothetical protein PS723_05024 [Pseudomonas fluorescens]|uniref:Uncharacterized protein n=1 Tax=Pseudomonas fluorescens TaxID=294 RepID=A0A5E7EXL6_PSEFL|nr:hypothetical protein PS723_05024 [Pseudomonas fluorescens]